MKSLFVVEGVEVCLLSVLVSKNENMFSQCVAIASDCNLTTYDLCLDILSGCSSVVLILCNLRLYRILPWIEQIIYINVYKETTVGSIGYIKNMTS